MRKRSARSSPVFVSTGAPFKADPPMSIPRTFMQKGSVVRSAGCAMRMAMRNFVSVCRTDGDYFHVEGQVDAREWVIRVEQNVIAFNRGHGDHGRVLIISRLKLIAHGQIAFNRNGAARHALDLRFVALAIGFGRCHLDHSFRARSKTEKLLLETVD